MTNYRTTLRPRVEDGGISVQVYSRSVASGVACGSDGLLWRRMIQIATDEIGYSQVE